MVTREDRDPDETLHCDPFPRRCGAGQEGQESRRSEWPRELHAVGNGLGSGRGCLGHALARWQQLGRKSSLHLLSALSKENRADFFLHSFLVDPKIAPD